MRKRPSNAILRDWHTARYALVAGERGRPRASRLSQSRRASCASAFWPGRLTGILPNACAWRSNEAPTPADGEHALPADGRTLRRLSAGAVGAGRVAGDRSYLRDQNDPAQTCSDAWRRPQAATATKRAARPRRSARHLSVALATTARALHCHAGCAPVAVQGDGLRWVTCSRQKQGDGHARIEATYDY